MPLLHDGAQRCTLHPGAYTLGGNGADALPIARLERYPAVATVTVRSGGAPTIQRLTARVVVFVDRNPLGIAAKELNDGAEIEFADCRLKFTMDDGAAAISSDANSSESEPWRAPAKPAAPAHASVSSPGRARLINPRTGESIELSNQRVVVGRDESCDFVLRGMHVSRRHFSVAPVEGGYVLRDESANGTVVNGSRVVGTYLLGAGDVLRLDEDELRFEVDGVAERKASTEAAPTTLLDLSYVRAVSADGAPREKPAATATLEIVRGQYTGASFAIDRPVCAIGRGPLNEVRIRDDSVSAAHATLLRKGRSWFVVDLRSSNGTFVDGSRVAGERELANGSRLKLGGVELVFRSLDADEPIEGRSKPSLMGRFIKKLAPRAV